MVTPEGCTLQRLPRLVPRALEALAQNPINSSALVMPRVRTSPMTPFTGLWTNLWLCSSGSAWSRAQAGPPHP
jgi:hypothetical protein